ncbi:MAG: hypothetical protein ACAI25_17880 [Planctomycetota bacterium]
MTDTSYEDRAKIHEILMSTGRLRFVLTDNYKVPLETVTKLRVDGDNIKVDVWVGERMLRFKAKGIDDVLVPDEALGGVKMALDPWLARELHRVVEDYAG